MTSSPDVTKHSTISMLKYHRKSHSRTKGRVERRQFAGSLTLTLLGLDKWSLFWTLHSKFILLNENCCIWFKFNWTQKVNNSFQASYYLPKMFCAILNIWCPYINIYIYICRFCFFMDTLTWYMNIDTTFSTWCIPVVLRVVTPNKRFTTVAILTSSLSDYNPKKIEYLAMYHLQNPPLSGIINVTYWNDSS